MTDLILASSSPHRAALLARLSLPFIQLSPDIDEAPQPEESPDALVRRLGREKAAAVSRPGSLVIASDQVCLCGRRMLGKPMSEAAAVAQLQALSGRRVTFLTSLVLENVDTGAMHTDVDSTEVSFRTLTDSEIQSYVVAEMPLDCAGAFKSEGLGVALFQEIATTDPTALVGLPLIRLAEFLRREGMNPLAGLSTRS